MTGCTRRHAAGSPTTSVPPGGTAAASDTASSDRVLYAWHGIEIIAVTDAQDERSPALYATTDLAHWRLITPPAASDPAVVSNNQPFFNQFISASFLNTLTGWVVACDQSSGRDVIYQTDDGGHTWQTIPDAGTDRCMISVQLLAPGVAIRDTQTNGYVVGGGGIVELTDNDGKTWQSLFSVPEGVQLPQVTPVIFADQGDGFSTSGFVPFTNIGSPGNGYFQVSRDGGRTWTAQSPPSPGGHVVYDLPTFVDSQDGVLPSLGDNGHKVRLQFDTTTTGGRSWHEQASLPIDTALTGDAQFPYNPYPAVSVASMDTWWVAHGANPVSVSVTVDGGQNWTTIAPQGLPATPTRLDAIDGTTALATVPRGSPGSTGYRQAVYVTNDAGQHWNPVAL
jgi:photosystem II stability/assembly factor-like uncharacterized protein